MHEMTKQNLKSSVAGESQAHVKYTIFSQIAEKEKKPNVSRIFKATAYAELVHAGNHLRALGAVGKSSDNLDAALEGEIFEVEEMYPAYYNEAKLQGEKAAEISTRYALEAEKMHIGIYKKAKQAVIADKDAEISNVYVCSVCGYTTEDEVDVCPVCGAKKDLFKQF